MAEDEPISAREILDIRRREEARLRDAQLLRELNQAPAYRMYAKCLLASDAQQVDELERMWELEG